jgi:hypothetical protein
MHEDPRWLLSTRSGVHAVVAGTRVITSLYVFWYKPWLKACFLYWVVDASI